MSKVTRGFIGNRLDSYYIDLKAWPNLRIKLGDGSVWLSVYDESDMAIAKQFIKDLRGVLNVFEEELDNYVPCSSTPSAPVSRGDND